MILQIWYNKVKPDYINRCMQSVKDAYKGHEYILITENEYKDLPYTIGADLKRLEMASLHDDLIYIDADCYIKEPYIPKGVLPCFGGDNGNDIFYFHANKNRKLFKGLYEKAKDDLLKGKYNYSSYGYYAFRCIESERIPRNSYYHLCTHRWADHACERKLKKWLQL